MCPTPSATVWSCLSESVPDRLLLVWNWNRTPVENRVHIYSGERSRRVSAIPRSANPRRPRSHAPQIRGPKISRSATYNPAARSTLMGHLERAVDLWGARAPRPLCLAPRRTPEEINRATLSISAELAVRGPTRGNVIKDPFNSSPHRHTPSTTFKLSSGPQPRAPLASSCHGPVIATVMPGVWMFTNSVLPSGEKHAPANSLMLVRPSL